MRANCGKELEVVRPGLCRSPKAKIGVGKGLALHSLIEIAKPNLVRKKVKLLDGAHIDLRMLAQIVAKRRSSGFGRSYEVEVGRTLHIIALMDRTACPA